MFKVFSKKSIANSLLIILVIIILTVSGIILTGTIKNKVIKPSETSSIVDAELV